MPIFACAVINRRPARRRRAFVLLRAPAFQLITGPQIPNAASQILGAPGPMHFRQVSHIFKRRGRVKSGRRSGVPDGRRPEFFPLKKQRACTAARSEHQQFAGVFGRRSR